MSYFRSLVLPLQGKFVFAPGSQGVAGLSYCCAFSAPKKASDMANGILGSQFFGRQNQPDGIGGRSQVSPGTSPDPPGPERSPSASPRDSIYDKSLRHIPPVVCVALAPNYPALKNTSIVISTPFSLTPSLFNYGFQGSCHGNTKRFRFFWLLVYTLNVLSNGKRYKITFVFLFVKPILVFLQGE